MAKFRCIQISDTEETYPIQGNSALLMNMVFYPSHINRKTTSQELDALQRSNGKTLSCNATSCLQFSTFIRMRLIFTVFV
jgi:hypothetical protein